MLDRIDSKSRKRTQFWPIAMLRVYTAGSNHDSVRLVILLMLALVPAGRIAGLDDGLCDRKPFLR